MELTQSQVFDIFGLILLCRDVTSSNIKLNLKSPVLTSDASISIHIRSLCASEDSHDISISFFLMLMFSEDIIDISIRVR